MNKPSRAAVSSNYLLINFRSIVNKVHNLHYLVHNYSPAFVFITETWLDAYAPSSLLFLNDFTVHRIDRQKRGGGLAILSHNSFHCKSVDLFIRDEIELLYISSQHKGIKMNHVLVYRPPQCSVPAFLDSLVRFLRNIDLETPTAIVGDFNVDISHPSVCHRSLTSSLQCLGFKALSKKPTRITALTSTCIDLFFCNATANGYFNFSDSVPVSFSDHNLVVYKFNCHRKRPEKKFIYKRCINPKSSHRFISSIEDFKYSEYSNVEDLTSSLVDLLRTYEVHFPLRKATVADFSTSPWVSSSLLNLIRRKEIAHKKFVYTRSTEALNIFRQKSSAVARKSHSDKLSY